MGDVGKVSHLSVGDAVELLPSTLVIAAKGRCRFA
jgi:hypothetical protein